MEKNIKNKNNKNMVCNFIDNFSYLNTQLLSDEKNKVTINKYLNMVFILTQNY